MKVCRSITLRLTANVDKYRLILRDGSRRCEYTNKRRDTIVFVTEEDSILLYASVKIGASGSSLGYRLDTRYRQCYDMCLNFVTPTPSGESVQIFSLKDARYGMPIDGVLRLEN